MLVIAPMGYGGRGAAGLYNTHYGVYGSGGGTLDVTRLVLQLVVLGAIWAAFFFAGKD